MPCPAKPNCVCSQYPNDPDHFIEPFIFDSKEHAQEAFEKLKTFKKSTFSVRPEKIEDHYIHLVFITKLFRFRDDVMFLLETNTIHVRSASRLGYSDLGVNRKRIESIRIWLKAI